MSEISHKSKTLTGKNLCDMSCVDKDVEIYPKTDITQVLTGGSNNQTLEEWIKTNPNPNSSPFSIMGSLKAWLNEYHPMNAVELNPATENVLGGVKIDTTYLTIGENTGLLGLNRASLNIPNYSQSTFSSRGIVYLGNDTTLPENFNNIPLSPETNYQIYPLRVDSNGKTGVLIPNTSFQQANADWDALDGVTQILNKPDLASVATSGSYNDLSNKPSINNSTITIKQNGITVNSFTLNQSTNKTININTNTLEIFADFDAKTCDKMSEISFKNIVGKDIDSIIGNAVSALSNIGNIVHIYINFFNEFKIQQNETYTYRLQSFFEIWDDSIHNYLNDRLGKFCLDVHFSFSVEITDLSGIADVILPLTSLCDENSPSTKYYYTSRDYSGYISNINHKRSQCIIGRYNDHNIYHQKVECASATLHDLNVQYSISPIGNPNLNYYKYVTLWHYHSADLTTIESNLDAV